MKMHQRRKRGTSRRKSRNGRLLAARILSCLVILTGIILMFYPWISSYWYEHGVQSTVNVYQSDMQDEDPEELDRLWQEAVEYNRELAKAQIRLTDPFTGLENEDNRWDYQAMLCTDDSGILCFVDIPKIGVYLPVFHGTSAEVLAKGAGHIEGSALPVGGEGNRPVISAHTGINSSKMFSDLTELEEGDLFFLHVLNRVLAYRVIRIEVIEPQDTESLAAEEGRDLVSLLTCTPYGVNTHRLVVTGARTEYNGAVLAEADDQDMDGESQWMRAYRRALLIGGGIVTAAWGLGRIAQRVRRSRRSAGRSRRKESIGASDVEDRAEQGRKWRSC